MTNWKQIVKPVDGSDFSSSSKATPRERFVGNLRSQLALFKDSAKAGKRHFEVKGEKIKFSARMGNMAVELLPGKREVVMEKKEFAAVIEAVIADVEKGDFDLQLNRIAENYAGRRKAAK
ncbi:MAG: hypothetical protein A3H25_11945 [Sphingomonadales bacterium RIFCSPLOWO2_12_FULL_63_15]|nr:MAG: hypothetical protein A3H25_11945 [Sphingomonadales bacterium RIFCSPLOWO2_12_FULL_63_15]